MKPTKKGGMTKGSAPPLRSRLLDEDEHQKRLGSARSERDRREIEERMRDVLAAARRKTLR
jgi:hypothetical protein